MTNSSSTSSGAQTPNPGRVAPRHPNPEVTAAASTGENQITVLVVVGGGGGDDDEYGPMMVLPLLFSNSNHFAGKGKRQM